MTIAPVGRRSLDPVAVRVAALVALWLASLLALSALSPYFLQARTVPYLLQYLPIVGLLGLGQTLVILGGGPGIDLSCGAILSAVGVAVAALMTAGVGIVAACLVGLALGVALGAVNGVVVERLGVPSLIATLASLFILGGGTVAVTGGRPVAGLPDAFAELGQGRTLGAPNAFLFVLLPVAVALHVALTRTTVGRHVVACGCDERSARLAGLDVGRLRIGLYAASGGLAALGSIVSTSWFMAARPDAGKGLELLSVTVAVLGGTEIFGGAGSIAGSLMAVLLVTTLQIGLQLANISAAWQLGVIGVLLIASVSLAGHRWTGVFVRAGTRR